MMWKIIENELKKQKMNQESLSKKMNVRSGIISDFKQGRIKKPSFELMCKFADALGISLDELRPPKKPPAGD